MTRTSLLAAGLAALLSGGCRQGPSQSVQPVGRRTPTVRARYTIWQKPLVDAVAERNCAVPLVVGQPVARRFRTPASGASLHGALYVIGTEDPEGRAWRMADVSIAVCRDVAFCLRGVTEALNGDTLVTVRVPAVGRVSRLPFSMECDLEPNADYWLVVEQVVSFPWATDAAGEPTPAPGSAGAEGASSKAALSAWMARGTFSDLPWTPRDLPTPDPVYLVQAHDRGEAVVWAAADSDPRPVVLNAPPFAADLVLLTRVGRSGSRIMANGRGDYEHHRSGNPHRWSVARVRAESPPRSGGA